MNPIYKFLFLTLILFGYTGNTVSGQEVLYKDQKQILYTKEQDSYAKEKCQLELYYPTDKKDFVTLVWFHGGGLTGGEAKVPDFLKDKGIAIAAVGYRFAPRVSVGTIINDAADAVQWVYDHIAQYGGNKKKIIIGGYSAGAYLSLMLGLDASYLQRRNVPIDDIYGIASLSGQAITHAAARKEKGTPELQPVIDELAPLYWVNKQAPRILLITGDRELELMGRYEENAYLYRMLGLVGHKQVRLLELDGYNHDMTYPAFPLLLKQIKAWE